MHSQAKADFNAKIVDHLRQRFRERFNVELTRDSRLSLLKQIQARTGELCYQRGDSQLWKVSLVIHHLRNFYHVIYVPKFQQIVTVLPAIGSPAFEKFCKTVYSKYGIPKEQVMNRRLSAKDLERESLHRMHRVEENTWIDEFRRKRAVAYRRLVCYCTMRRLQRSFL